MEAATALQYRYSGLAQEIICDSDAISGIRQSLDGLGVKRALVVCGPTILEKSNVVQRVQEALGGYCAGLFSGVAPHSPIEVVERAVEIAGELNPDCLVSVGGGSTHDTCKGIAMMLAEGGDIHDYEMRFEPPDKVITPHTPHEKMPIISVPTTMGGAELSRGGGGFTDKALGRKILRSGAGNGHRVVIIDGQSIATLCAELDRIDEDTLMIGLQRLDFHAPSSAPNPRPTCRGRRASPRRRCVAPWCREGSDSVR